MSGLGAAELLLGGIQLTSLTLRVPETVTVNINTFTPQVFFIGLFSLMGGGVVGISSKIKVTSYVDWIAPSK